MIKTLIENPEVKIEPYDIGVREMVVMFNRSNIWHYKNGSGTKNEHDTMTRFVDALLKKRIELLESDLPLIHSKQHNTTIYAHKADA